MRKFKNKKGLTLVEMLVCVLTLILVGAICATGTGISIKSYQESRFESNSQMLQASVEAVLSDILRYAANIEVAEDGTVATFDSLDYGMIDGNVFVTDQGEFAIRRNPNPSEPTKLMLTHNAYAKDLYVEGFTLKYDLGMKKFEGTYIIKSKVMPDKPGKTCTFSYRTIID